MGVEPDGRRVPDGGDQDAVLSGEPGRRETLDRLMSGKADGMLVLDLDRATRDPRDLEDLIDIVEHHDVPTARRKGPGPAPRWLGSGIYRCGICTPPGTDTDTPVTCEVTLGGRSPRYRCKEHNHLARNAAHVDEYVIAHVAYQLTHPHADKLLAPPAPEVDADALRTERTAIRKRLEQMARDEVLGRNDVTRAQVREATKAALERIAEIDQLVTANVTTDPLAEVILADDPLAEFDKAPLSSQRVYLDRLVT
jgi:hypothetical protein